MNHHSNNTNLLLEQYLDGTLSVEDSNRIKALLEADPALREELEAMQLAMDAVRHKGLYTRVKSIRKVMLENEPVNTKPARRFTIVRSSLRIAASLLILAGAFAIYKYAMVTRTSVYNDLYLQYEPTRTRSMQTDPAETAFLQKNWNEVIARTEKNTTVKNLFLSGMAYLESGQPSEAISRFENILQKNAAAGSDQFNDEAEYYLALAYIRNGQPTNASALLKTISNKADHLYREKAAASSGINLKILEWKDK